MASLSASGGGKPSSGSMTVLGYSKSVELTLLLCGVAEMVDKSLLGAFFQSLHVDLAASPSQLGWLALAQALTGALALPFWGTLSVRHPPRDLLCAGCLIWGAATGLMALFPSFWAHCALRAVNGFGLCAVMPVSQAVIVNLVPDSHRGRAFGRLQAFAGVAGMLASGYALTQQSVVLQFGSVSVHGWQRLYFQVAIGSVALALMVRRSLHIPAAGGGSSEEVEKTYSMGEMFATVRRIAAIPSFSLLVLQGMIGVIPWNAMSFMSFYFLNRGFTEMQVGLLAVVYGVGCAVGAVLGGSLGDRAAEASPSQGRIAVAIASVGLGLPLWVAVFSVAPSGAGIPVAMMLLVFFFPMLATWTSAAACRPICAELVSKPLERAQVVAWVAMMEGVSGSVFGGPFVGALAERFGFHSNGGLSPGGRGAADVGAALALARALKDVGVVCWILCAFLWVLMSFSFPKDRFRGNGECLKPHTGVSFGACA